MRERAVVFVLENGDTFTGTYRAWKKHISKLYGEVLNIIPTSVDVDDNTICGFQVEYIGLEDLTLQSDLWEVNEV